MVEVKCTWVPGTVDTLNIRAGAQQRHLNMAQLRRLFGQRAMNAMYLTGSYRTYVDVNSLTFMAMP